MEAPSHRYFRAMHGPWRGPMSFTITDAAALAAVPSFVDRSFWHSSAWAPGMTMTTRMEYDPRTVVHHTRVSMLGLPGAWGVERFILDPDGRRFRIEAEHTLAPFRRITFAGDGEVNEDASGATYRFTYLCVPLVQTTRIEGELLVASQVTAFSKSEARLARRR